MRTPDESLPVRLVTALQDYPHAELRFEAGSGVATLVPEDRLRSDSGSIAYDDWLDAYARPLRARMVEHLRARGVDTDRVTVEVGEKGNVTVSFTGGESEEDADPDATPEGRDITRLLAAAAALFEDASTTLGRLQAQRESQRFVPVLSNGPSMGELLHALLSHWQNEEIEAGHIDCSEPEIETITSALSSLSAKAEAARFSRKYAQRGRA